MLESVINTLFTIMDTAMLGHVPNSTQAIASVGLNTAVINLLVCVIANFCIGTTVVISQSVGANNMEKCRKTAIQMLPIMTVIGIFATVLLSTLAPVIITLLGANDEIKADAITYLRIIGYGLVFQTVTMYITAVFRGIGQTKIPMVYNLVAGVINIIGNYCLINGHFGFPALRVAGAAWATTFAKVVICFVSLYLFFKLETPIRPYKDEIFRPGLTHVAEVCKNGAYSALEQFVLQFGAVVTTSIITVIATTPYAAYQVALSVQSMIWAVTGIFGVAATSMAGMAKGEKNMQKVQTVTNYIWKLGMIVAAALFLVYFFAGGFIASLYTDKPEVYKLTGKLLRLASPMLFGVCTHQTLAGCMRGVSYPKYPLVSALISLWLCRVIGTFIVVRLLGLGIEWVVVCATADQMSRALVNMFFYNKKIIKPNRLSLKGSINGTI